MTLIQISLSLSLSLSTRLPSLGQLSTLLFSIYQLADFNQVGGKKGRSCLLTSGRAERESMRERERNRREINTHPSNENSISFPLFLRRHWMLQNIISGRLSSQPTLLLLCSVISRDGTQAAAPLQPNTEPRSSFPSSPTSPLSSWLYDNHTTL